MNANYKTTTSRAGNVPKWEALFRSFGGWNTARQRCVQEHEGRQIAAWLLELDRNAYNIVEIGCGNGYVGYTIISQLLAAKKDVTYCFSDLLPQCLDAARAAVSELGASARISFRQVDVYTIDQSFAPESVDIVVSTGFVSAATYRDAVPHVVRVLKPGGLFIADFINHLSPLIVLRHPISSLRNLWLHLAGRGEGYHCGMLGLSDFFLAHGLTMLRHRTFRIRRNPLLCMFEKGL